MYYLPSEQKECHKGSHRTKDQMLIDKKVLRDCKRRHTNLAETVKGETNLAMV